MADILSQEEVNALFSTTDGDDGGCDLGEDIN